jgi:hypothetical protein
MNLLDLTEIQTGTIVAKWNATGLSIAAVSAWADGIAAKSLAQATAGLRPAAQASIFGTAPGVKFDGVDDILTYAAQLTAATTAGTLACVFKTGTSVVGPFVLFGAADTASANNWFEVGISSTGKIYIESNVSGTKQTIFGSTLLDVSTAYRLVLTYDGTDWWLSLTTDSSALTGANSVIEEDPLTIENIGAFAWIGGVTGTQNFSVGANNPNGTAARFFNGHIGSVYLWSGDITA